jgi:hypothetical protein
MRFIGVNIRFTKVDNIIGLNMFVSENLRLTVYGGLIVTSVCRGNFNRLKYGFQKRLGFFGLLGFGLSGLTL